MSEKTIDYGKFGKFGAVGVMLALISLTSFALYAYWKTVSNHISHNTEATLQFSKAVEGNTEVIRANSVIMNNLNQTLKIRSK